ncbi:MAG: hypothetical protein IJR49_02135 [Treponema sp.]|nr:hypothetical protein [Treponema sp.]
MQQTDARWVKIIKRRVQDLETLALSVKRFPSLLKPHELAGGIRTPSMLVNAIIDYQEHGDKSLHMPSKAILSKGFLVAKMHIFSSLSRQAARINAPEELSQELKTEAVNMMFTILAEDVYLNFICDKTQDLRFRKKWAYSLIRLWQYRTDQTVSLVAPMLNAVWTARRKLAPVFGTMLGTSELLLISMQMDDLWIKFIKNKLSDNNVALAMEEFLFGISYEQITCLREILKEKGINAIGRDEVSSFLNIKVKADLNLDYKDFYALYTVRRDDARARLRLNVPGPHKTLEDYFFEFVTEQSRGRNDIGSY